MTGPPTWSFRRMHAGEMNIDPIESEFFSTEALDSLGDALVREAIQNSLDARRPTERLRMRIAFSTPKTELTGAGQARYTSGLWEHVATAKSGVSEVPRRNEPLSYLVIEDFGTRGLQGDPRQSEDDEAEASAQRNDFYFFWRNIGRSRKSTTELGRWGLGKTVFPAGSRANAFFALTVRHDDGRRLLMGQAVTKVHKLAAVRYYPYGYFGVLDGELALPTEDPFVLDAFTRDFGLARTTEPGLSIVVPYPAEELAGADLVPSIVQHYFVAIIAGVLLVEVVADGKTTLVDATHLARIVSAMPTADAQRLRPLLELARWAHAVHEGRHVELEAPEEASAPKWVDERIDPERLPRLREQLDAGGRLALTVPVWVKAANAASTLSHFEVYLERDELLSSGDEHFIRDYITVTGVRGALPKGYRCIVSVRDKPLAALLGDSENPAHTEWQERSPKFKDRYRHGATTLRYVRNVPREIVRALTRPAEGKDYGLLRQIFSIEDPVDATPFPSPLREAAPGSDGEEISAPALVARDRFFELTRLVGGFRLNGAGEKATVPPVVAVEVAYEVRRGNPFAHYQRLDFELDQPPIEVAVHGVDVLVRGGNRLLFRAVEPSFSVVVKGFHVFRDVRVRVTPVALVNPA